ncbi:MAG: hypothetical protein WDN00_02600 [Limisphaerales bacterium]
MPPSARRTAEATIGRNVVVRSKSRPGSLSLKISTGSSSSRRFGTHVDIGKSEGDELKRRIEFDPDLFVAQERVELATAPAWGEKFTAAQPVSLRVFLWRMARVVIPSCPAGWCGVAPDSSGSFNFDATWRQQQGYLDSFDHSRG